ncbi:MAG: hypothetical protein KC502_22430 [Myxococcales bacterium]|nr:hypothetical protein [Myxococcales bacterium]
MHTTLKGPTLVFAILTLVLLSVGSSTLAASPDRIFVAYNGEGSRKGIFRLVPKSKGKGKGKGKYGSQRVHHLSHVKTKITP